MKPTPSRTGALIIFGLPPLPLLVDVNVGWELGELTFFENMFPHRTTGPDLPPSWNRFSMVLAWAWKQHYMNNRCNWPLVEAVVCGGAL